MDFLFAPLPEANSEMTDDQLRLWQRNAIFECECDNFINRRIEAGRGRLQLRQVQTVEQSAIESAIQQHGLEIYAGRREESDDASIYTPPAAQRPRLISTTTERERDNVLDSFYQEAIAFAIRERGLGLRNNS